jgi:3-deoxy-D-manno-octulosonic-acid transferase
MGMLMHVYQFGDVAYVGGAFGKGLHNILEPAAFGIPVIFGANYKKFNEANLFIQKGFAASVQNQAELLVAFNRFEQAGLRNEILHFMNEMQGSTAIILSKT